MENCFLYCPFSVAATALFLFRLTKSRRTFYAQIECLCFHTASGMRSRSRRRGFAPAIGSVRGPSRERGATGETGRFRPSKGAVEAAGFGHRGRHTQSATTDELTIL